MGEGMQRAHRAARLTRLPTWAQEEIRLLEAQNAWLKTQIAAGVTGDHPETNAHVQANGLTDDFVPSKYRTVQFRDGDAMIDVRWDHEFKRLRVAASGFEYLAVLPHSSNVVHIKTRKDYP